MKEYYKIIEENHTGYCACFQRIKWNVANIAGYENSNGFIVQKFNRTSVPANLIIADTSYYEAWSVQNGVCIDTNKQKYDDEFAVGHSMCQFCVFENSLNKEGEYKLIGEVFWVDRVQGELYAMVSNWPIDEVKQAGGLRAVFNTDLFDNEKPKFIRVPFVHKWYLKGNEDIYRIARDTLFRRCHNPGNERVQDIFEGMLANMFGDKYVDIQEKLRCEWKNYTEC